MNFFNLKSEDGKITELRTAVVSVLGYERIKGVVLSDKELQESYESSIKEYGGNYTLDEFISTVHEARE